MKKKFLCLLFVSLLLTGCNPADNSSVNSSENNSSIISEQEEMTSVEVTSTTPTVTGSTTALKNVQIQNKKTNLYTADPVNSLVDEKVEECENGSIYIGYPSTYYGNKNYVAAIPRSGYHLSYILNNDKYVGNELKTYFYASLFDNFSAEFTKDDQHSVLFLDVDGRYLSSVTANTNQTVSMYSYPEIEGYEIQFNIDVTLLDSVDQDLIVRPTYIKEGIVTIDSTDCTYAEKIYHYGDTIDITANKTNKLFEYYKVNGEIFSSDQSLTMTLYDDVNIEVVYGDTFNLPSPMASINTTVQLMNERAYFTCNSAPYTNKLNVESGLLVKEKVDDTFVDTAVFKAEIGNDLGDYFISAPADSSKFYQAYTIYRTIDKYDTYVYVILTSDVYQLS